MLSNLVASLIKHRRITTTVAKAKAIKPLADKMVTLGKKGDLAARRRAISVLRQPIVVKQLFTEIAPLFKDRQGGYTRIIKLGHRKTDAAPMALIEWTDSAASAEAPAEATVETTAKE